MHDHLALGGEAPHQQRVEAAEGIPVEMTEIVARFLERR